MRNLLTAACLALCAAPAAAWEVADVVSLRVLPGYRAANGQHFAAFQIDLAPGWKTYWRAPGEAGIPPVVTWEGSQNIQAAQFHWPVPQVFNQSGMQSIGYAGQVTLPIEISVADSSAPIHLSGQLQIGVCEEICVPVSFSFDHILTAETRRNGAIVAALVDRPLTGAEAGAGPITCTLTPQIGALGLQLDLTVPALGPDEVLAIETDDPAIWVSPPVLRRDGAHLTALSDMIHAENDSFAFNRSTLRVTLIGNGQAIEMIGCAAG